MKGWLYIIRNRDLYKIGITRNFEKRMQQLKPDNIIAKLYTSNFMILEKELHNRYKEYRIPQTEYFRLEDYHLKEINQRICNLDYPMSYYIVIFIKSLLFVFLLSIPLFLIIALNFNDINVILRKLVLWMERIIFGYSFFSLFVNSGKYLGVLSEIKYRFLRLTVYMFFGFFFRIVSNFLQ